MEALAVGGPGSGRWHDHKAGPLVEECFCIDLVRLRRAGALSQDESTGSLEWTSRLTGEQTALALYSLVPTSDGLRELSLSVTHSPTLLYTAFK